MWFKIFFKSLAYNGYDSVKGDRYTIVQHGNQFQLDIDPDTYCMPLNFSIINPGYSQGKVFTIFLGVCFIQNCLINLWYSY